MIESIQLSNEVELKCIGPSIEKGRLPAIVYFAISGEDSLGLDPYNQPALFLAQHEVRIFSMDLPAHGPNLNALDAIDVWAKAFREGSDPLSPFINQVIFAINELIDRGIIIAEKIGLMGLSRGGLIACLVAAKFPAIRGVVGFAPMTQLSHAKEFKPISDLEKVQEFNLENYLDPLSSKKMRFYIGNRDIRVGTDRCFHLVEQLAERAYQNGLRSPPIEMVVSPSIGHMGHGTSKEIFHDGAAWLGKILGVIR